MNAVAPLDESRLERASQLLASAGYPGPFRLVPLAGGANNQVFRVVHAGPALVLKAYFCHPNDSRDRLGSDYGFSHFAWTHGIRAVAQPLACDVTARLALFEHVEGVKLRPGEVGAAEVQQALDFYLAVNRHRHTAEARQLPLAAEACFTLREHFHCLERRIERLQGIRPSAPEDTDAVEFIRNDLMPRSNLVLQQAAEQAATLAIDLDAPVPEDDRCLSPSDFGFHNALRLADGSMKFIDFEYAGWDDPGKLVADFFCQPECPVPLTHFDEFADAIAHSTTNGELHRKRFHLLLPVYRLKWCCIMLNDFLPRDAARRRFARSGIDETDRKRLQLRKARVALRLPLAA